MKKLMMAAAVMGGLAMAGPALAQEDGVETEYLELFMSYLDIADQFVDFASDSASTVFLATEGIVEIHEQRGEEAAAIPLLQEALALYPDNQAARNILRFKLRDLYRDTGQTELALAELRLILEENR